MASTSRAGIRTRSASTKQLAVMLDFFVKTPGLADGMYLKLYGKSNHEKKWLELAIKLNTIGKSVKTVYQWQTVWRNLKRRICIRFHDRKMLPDQPPITNFESRVIGLLGSKYIEEHGSVAKDVIVIDELSTDSDGTVSVDSTEFPEIKCSKIEREYEESDIQTKFLEIAEKQADALKIISECSLASVRAANSMVAATNLIATAINSMTASIKVMEADLKACVEAFITNSRLDIEHIKKDEVEVDEFVLSE